MLTLRLSLLGSFDLTVDGEPDVGRLESRKAQELLGLLMVSPGRCRSREAAIEALWSDCSATTGRRQIRQALWHVHRITDLGVADDERLILAAAEHLSINSERNLECDALEFAETVESIDHEGGPGADRRKLEQALELYRGPFLDGFYSEWCVVERERLEDLYIAAIDTAASLAEADGDYPVAGKWARTLLHCDPAHEPSHRRLMRIYYEMDDRSRALHQFERCRHALETELAVRPSQQTMALAAAIREGTVPAGGHRAGGRINGANGIVDRANEITNGANGIDPTDRGAHVDGTDPADLTGPSIVVRELVALRRSIDELRRALQPHAGQTGDRHHRGGGQTPS